ncbi:tryptophan-rich sensory protein [Dehalobacter sp. DCM]|uniref:tryptophan-rich sensory protein n=1 Tax=Dehalobacter sp. DCM TaxID=2907827 RepID=UPI0030816194|nr:tryptophan-rich sensory protein [Dehalobacter sp. DCM]
MEESKHIFLKSFAAISFIIMVAVNALANMLPINGVTTGEVSDSYPNLFAPAGLTFSIWGLIYLLLALFTLYQVGLFQSSWKFINEGLLHKIRVIFTINALANATWILTWHYKVIMLSMALMIVILITLILIVDALKKEKMTRREAFFLRLPFSIYFGWITVATIANMTTLLVSLGWQGGFGLSASGWTIVILLAGMVIASATMIVNKDIAYGLVPIWAYIGIVMKHLSATGFAGKYPAIITTAEISIVVFVISLIIVIVQKRRDTRQVFRS